MIIDDEYIQMGPYHNILGHCNRYVKNWESWVHSGIFKEIIPDMELYFVSGMQAS